MINKYILHLQSAYSQNQTIFRNITAAFIIKGGAMLVYLLSMPAYIRYLDNQSALGVWFGILSVLNWALMFDLGLGYGLRNCLAKALALGEMQKAKKLISSAYLTMGIPCVLIGLLGLIGFTFVPWNLFFNISSAIIDNKVLCLCMQITFLGFMLQLILRLVNSIFFAMQKAALPNLLVMIPNLLIYCFLLAAPKQNLPQAFITLSIVYAASVNIPLTIATYAVFSGKMRTCKPSVHCYNLLDAKAVFNTGIAFLILQFLIMMITVVNEFAIIQFASPEAVVEYQIYFKIFNSISAILSLAFQPLWSAVTKAYALHNYAWINRCHTVLLWGSAVMSLVLLLFIPFLEFAVKLWLGSNAIAVTIPIAIIFALFNGEFLFHNANCFVANGMNYLKPQFIWLTFAGVVKLPLAYFLIRTTGSWSGVVFANFIALLPLTLIYPVKIKGFLHSKMCNEQSRNGGNEIYESRQ